MCQIASGPKAFFLEGGSRSLKLKNPFLAISISVTRHSLLSVHRATPFLELGLRLSLIEKKLTHIGTNNFGPWKISVEIFH